MLGMLQMFSKIGFVICFIMIGWLSLSDGNSVVQVGNYDKIVHLISYLCLSLSFWFAFHSKIEKHSLILLTLMLLIGYGVLIEILQSFVPGRFSSVMDGIANAVGVILGWLILMLAKQKCRCIDKVKNR